MKATGTITPRAWIALLVPPLAFLTDAGVSYALVQYVCFSGNALPIWIASAVFIALVAWGGWIGKRELDSFGEGDANRVSLRFILQTAVMLAAVCLIGSLSLVVVKAMVDPCSAFG